MPAYTELQTLVTEVNNEVAELDAAKNLEAQAAQILAEKKAVSQQEATQVKAKLNELQTAINARISELG